MHSHFICTLSLKIKKHSPNPKQTKQKYHHFVSYISSVHIFFIYDSSFSRTIQTGQLMNFCSPEKERLLCSEQGANGPTRRYCNMPWRTDDPTLADCRSLDTLSCCIRCCTWPTPWGTFSPYCEDKRLDADVLCDYELSKPPEFWLN